MPTGNRSDLSLIGLLVVAPIGAAVVIVTLLAVGVPPYLVFLPGHFVKAGLGGFSTHVRNAVGVMTTFVVWWALVVATWMGVRRLWRRRAT